jgi:heme exporter protein A
MAGIGRVDEGEVRWGGEPIRRSEGYRQALAYLGHHNSLKHHLNSIENYHFYQSIAGYSSEIGAKEALGAFGLPAEAQERPVGFLSMGQKRRAALARLLAVKAQLWLLDEPLTSLDVDGIAFMTGLLTRHLKEGGMAVLATHQALALEGIPLQRLELGASP